jgi:hypothetical protein
VVKIYADLVQQGLKTLEQVPTIWREATRAELEKRGYFEATPNE